MTESKKSNWGGIAFAVCAGIAAGFQIGKVPPSIPYIQASLDASLVTIGWIISVFNLLGVFLGIASGIVADRFGSRNLITLGIFMLVLGAISGSFSENVAQLIITRVIAGLGLVTIAVAAPKLIAMASNQNDRSLALGIWGIYMPTGMALGMLVSPLLLGEFGWRGLWQFDAFFLLIFLFVFRLGTRKIKTPPVPQTQQGSRIREIGQAITHVGPWLLGMLFALYAVQFFAVMNWLPTFLVEALNYSAHTAAIAAALVVACNAIGNIGAAWLLHNGAQRWFLQLAALLIMAGCGLGIYPDFLDHQWKYPLALVFSTAGGMLPAATLAASAAHAPTPGQVATVNGVIVQCTNIGSLSGPPLMAMVVTSTGGWTEGWKMLMICGFLGILCVIAIRYIEKKNLLAH